MKTVTSNGILITGISEHALDRADGTDRAVTSKEIVEALKKPLRIENIRVNRIGLRSQRFIGSGATVNLNPDTGIVITVWKTSSRERRRHKKKEG